MAARKRDRRPNLRTAIHVAALAVRRRFAPPVSRAAGRLPPRRARRAARGKPPPRAAPTPAPAHACARRPFVTG
ncbi:hypothetical protein BURPS1106B_A2819 [Burkholderia pseudomallei 1106b]|nr:hypothetical protein BURPS1106B_A2819 [Burkholderia pseudomallei 1106b]